MGILFVLVKGKDAHHDYLGYADFIYGVNRDRILSYEKLESAKFEFLDVNYLINNLKKGIGGGGLLLQEATKLIGKVSDNKRGLKTQVVKGQKFRLKFLTEERIEEYFDIYTNEENSEFLDIFLKVNYDRKLSDEAKSQKGGCFIATACYGSYDSPEVLELRRYRDSRLKKSKIGKILITIYYSISPKLVRLIGTENKRTNFVKIVLIEPFLRIIRKYDR